MLTVDVIMPSLSTPNLQGMIKNCIYSLQKSEDNIKFNVILIESAKDQVDLGQDITIQFDLPKFNFHHAVNQGLKASSAEWVVIANNDLIFFPKWMSAILDIKAQYDIFDSFSPFEPLRHPKHFTQPYVPFYEGYKVSVTLAGWCLVTTKKVLNKIELSEEIAHWFSDNNYADELLKYGFRHALVTNSLVHHLEEQTSRTLPNYRELTSGQMESYLTLLGKLKKEAS